MNPRAKAALARMRATNDKGEPIYADMPNGPRQGIHDMAVLANEFAREHPADEDTLVLSDWLLAVGFHVNDEGQFRLRDGDGNELSILRSSNDPALFEIVEFWQYPPESRRATGVQLLSVGSLYRKDIHRLCDILGFELHETPK